MVNFRLDNNIQTNLVISHCKITL